MTDDIHTELSDETRGGQATIVYTIVAFAILSRGLRVMSKFFPKTWWEKLRYMIMEISHSFGRKR